MSVVGSSTGSAERAGASRGVLASDVASRGPSVIGATGGSGTRVVARIIRACSVYIGDDLNKYEDSLRFGAFSDRWINAFVGSNGDTELRARMTADLESVLDEHLAGRENDAKWGWKEPRSIYLVPFFRDAMPSLRFLHFVRDGRDMALSKNQQQLMKHGSAVLPRAGWLTRDRERSIDLWARVNTMAADFGERELGDRYRRVRFEDLCAEPTETIRSILDFFGLAGDAAVLSSEVRPPESLGRWRKKSSRITARLERIASDALTRFGYA